MEMEDRDRWRYRCEVQEMLMFWIDVIIFFWIQDMLPFWSLFRVKIMVYLLKDGRAPMHWCQYTYVLYIVGKICHLYIHVIFMFFALVVYNKQLQSSHILCCASKLTSSWLTLNRWEFMWHIFHSTFWRRCRGGTS
jgi:hypothetical protein